MKNYIFKDDNDFNTNMYKLIQEFKIKDLNYKWLITDIETNQDELFNKEYIIIKHQDLISFLENNKDIQWIWAVFSLIPSKYNDDEILKYHLPYIIENENINHTIQHPLAELEIDCIDSTYVKIIFKDNNLINFENDN